MQMSEAPQNLIVDMGEEMITLCGMLENPNLPMIDKDALFDQLVEIVCCPTEAEQEIAAFKKQIFDSDILLYWGPVEPDKETVTNVEKVTAQIGRAAHELSQVIRSHGFVQDNYFNYEFHRNIHDQTLVFSRKER